MALRWYRLSAEQGHPSAQLNLAFCYAEGLGVVQDELQAFMWIAVAADDDRQRLFGRDYITRELADELRQATIFLRNDLSKANDFRSDRRSRTAC